VLFSSALSVTAESRRASCFVTPDKTYDRVLIPTESDPGAQRLLSTICISSPSSLENFFKLNKTCYFISGRL
jgi:hypothetical protein